MTAQAGARQQTMFCLAKTAQREMTARNPARARGCGCLAAWGWGGGGQRARDCHGQGSQTMFLKSKFLVHIAHVTRNGYCRAP